MAYSTNAQVASEFKSITFSSSTSVTDTEVDRFIVEADEEINSQIGRVYVVPIVEADSPLAFPVVRMLSIWLVAERVREIMQLKSIMPTRLKQQGRMPLDSAERAREMLESIAARKMQLLDAKLKTTHGGVASFNSDNAIDAQWEKGVDQW